MKGWRISSFGIDHLEAFEAPIPKPLPGQIVIKVHAASLNYRDLMMVKGFYNPKMALPRIPCSDGAGEIVEAGEGVTDFKPGDRVAGIFMQRWIDGPPSAAKQKAALGGDVDGMLAEYVALDATGVVRLPEHLSYEEGATLPCAGVTAWNAVVTEAGTKPGDTVLIQGTGGVSIFALQFARLLGARVLGTSGSDEKLEQRQIARPRCRRELQGTSELGRLGAGRNRWPRGGPGRRSRRRRDLCPIAQSGARRRHDRPDWRAFAINRAAADRARFSRKQVRVQGIFVGSRADFLAMNRAISQNKLKPVIDSVFAFADARAAFQKMEAASHFGKIVIRMAV